MTARDRFEAWMEAEGYEQDAHCPPFIAWQAAERETAKACAKIADEWPLPVHAGTALVDAIRQAFPEAFEGG